MVNLQKEEIEKLVSVIALARLRPGMYLGVVNSDTLRAFKSGFYIGSSLLSFEMEREIWRERGWGDDSRPIDAIHQMQEKGLGINEIILETFTTVIIAIQRQYGISNEPVVQAHNVIRSRINDSTDEMSRLTLEAMMQLEEELGITSEETTS